MSASESSSATVPEVQHSSSDMSSPNTTDESSKTAEKMPENIMSPVPPSTEAPNSPVSIRASRPLQPAAPESAPVAKHDKKPVNFLASLHTPVYTYRAPKEMDAEAAAFAEDMAKFRKAQAAQRSLQWQFDEQARLFSRLEASHQALSADYVSLYKDKETFRKHSKTLDKEIERLSNCVADAQFQQQQSATSCEARIASSSAEAAAALAERDAAQARVLALEQQLADTLQQHDAARAAALAEQEQLLSSASAREAQARAEAAQEAEQAAATAAQLASEQKQSRQQRAEVAERDRAVAALQAELSSLSGRLAEAEQTVTSLRPWEVRFHGLSERSARKEEELTASSAGHAQRADGLAVLLRRVLLRMLGRAVEHRVSVCGLLRRVGELGAEAEAVAATVGGGAGGALSADDGLGLRRPKESRDREITRLLTRIRSVSVSSLLGRLEEEVGLVAETVSGLAGRAVVLHRTCAALEQSAIAKTGEVLGVAAQHERLREHAAALEKRLADATVVRDREAQNNVALASKVHILEREVAVQQRTRRHAHSLASLLREHSKLQSVQEQLLAVRRRVSELGEEKREEEARLGRLQGQGQGQRRGGAGDKTAREADEYDMALPAVLPTYTPRRTGARADTETDRRHDSGRRDGTGTVRGRPARSMGRGSPSKGRLPRTEKKMVEVEAVYGDRGGM